MHYYSLEKLINLCDGYRKTFKIDSHHLLLLQTDGQRFLIESLCPHRAYPLSMADIQGHVLICPKHAYCFDLRNGQVKHYSEEPCRDLRHYELVYQGNEVGVMLD